jgi:cell division protein FtsB
MDILSAINTTMNTLKKLKEVNEALKSVEIKQLVADLSDQLADAKLAAADLKGEIADLKEENAALKVNNAKEELPQIKDGCYFFRKDRNRLFCPTCYDRDGKKFLVADVLFTKKCNNCNGIFNAKH